MAIVYIALGSNLNDPINQINTALGALKELIDVELLAVSAFYKNPPYKLTQQPDFVNAVAKIDTALSPEDLLKELNKIEAAQGRIRNPSERNAPRTIDLDILLYGNLEISTQSLIIPHYDLAKRNFFLYPLAEIAPDLILPDGQALKTLLGSISAKELEKLGTT